VSYYFAHRVLVPSDFIGAIIGRKGQTIRHITAETNARSDLSVVINCVLTMLYRAIQFRINSEQRLLHSYMMEEKRMR
jgi:ribosomal protein S3